MFESDSNEESELHMTRVSDALRETGADKNCSDQIRKLIDVNNLVQQIKLTDNLDGVHVTRDLEEDGHKKHMMDHCEQVYQPWQKSPRQDQVEAQFDHENIGVNDKDFSGPGNLKDKEVLLTQSREVNAMADELNKIKEVNALIKVEMVEIPSIKEKLAKDLDSELKKENVDIKKIEKDLKEKLTLTEIERTKLMDSALKALIEVEVERKVFTLEEEIKAIRRQYEDKNEQLMKLGRNLPEVLPLAENKKSSNNEDTESTRQNCQVFVRGVDEHIKHHEMMAEFGKYGTVTEAYNTAKGYAFITFSSHAEAKDCLDDMNGRSVFGQAVQIEQAFGRCNLLQRLAKQREITRAAARVTDENSSIFENCQVFVRGVDEHIKHHEMMEEFGKYGTVTEAYNTAKGYAFITFSSHAEAKDCLNDMNGRSVFGQAVQIEQAFERCNLWQRLAKQREITRAAARVTDENSSLFENCQVFVRGVDEHINHHEMMVEFGKYGTVTEAYNTCKGYAFITYSSPAEAKDCLSGMNGRSLFGQAVQIEQAFVRSNLPQRLIKQKEITRAAARVTDEKGESNSKQNWPACDKNNNCAIEETPTGSVVKIYNLNPQFMDCDRLFNLFSPYAPVRSIKFLQPGFCKAMVKLNSKKGAQRVMKFMKEEVVFGKTMKLEPSSILRVAELDPDQSPCLPNGTKAFKDFYQDNRRHHFHYCHHCQSYMYPPSRTVYFSKASKMSDEDLKDIFEKREAPVPYKIMWFQNKNGMGCLQFKTKEKALQAMCIANLAPTKSGQSVHLAFTYERKDGEFWS